MDQIIIRPATMQDKEALRMLYYEFHEFNVYAMPEYLASLGNYGEQDWTRLDSALEKIFADENACIFLAEINNSPTGLVEVYIRQDDKSNALIVPHKYGYVQSVMVQEEAHCKGLGKKLMQTAQDWARSKGATEMRLEVWEFEAGPFQFYEKIGYRTLKREMVKSL